MNSEQLKNKFPEVYKDFFSKCVVVCSAPAAFFWCGEWAVAGGGLAIKQTLPLRLYVGLEITNEPGVRIKYRYNFDPVLKKFVIKETPSERNLLFVKTIKPLIEQLIDTKKFGINIYRLTEFVTSAGISASSAYCGSLALALYLLANKISKGEVEKWKKYSLPELNDKKELKFDEIFRLGWKMENFLHYHISSGAGVYTSMVGESEPITYLIEKDKEAFGTIQETNVDKTLYYADTLKNILKLSGPLTWPISFGLIYSGLRVNARVAIKSGREAKEKFSKSYSFGQEKNFKLLPEKFLTALAEQDFGRSYFNTLNLNNLSILKYFKKIFTSAQPADIEALLSKINNCQNILRILDLSAKELDAICSFLQIKGFENSFPAGTKLTGAGKAGHILFAFPTQEEEKIIHEYLSDLSRKMKTTTTYLSWLDGPCEEGVKVEQDLRNNSVSEFLSAGSIVLKIWEKGTAQERCLSRDQFEKEKNKFDLILDEEEGKLIIGGKKATSQEFHSQKTTIEVLKVLLENLDREVTSQNLPASSYSIDRNEMQSKIISPLKQTLKKILQKNLPLKISGGLGRNYFLKLSLGGCKVGLVKRRF